MIDREKVIKELTEIYDEAYDRWVHRPYVEDKLVTLIRDGIPDVLALLREQEPRVLTLEEVRDEAEYMFLEKRSATWSDLFGCAIRGDWDGYGMDLLLGEDDYIRGMWENYGKTWRCWTARPTDEQRKAVKWDD